MDYIYFTVEDKNVDDPKVAASILLRRRRDLKMTQQQVACAAGVDVRLYQRLEKGDSHFGEVRARTLLDVCAALKLDPYLFVAPEKALPSKRYLTIPPLSQDRNGVSIPWLAFATVVNAIPCGMVAESEEILDLLNHIYAGNGLRYALPPATAYRYARKLIPEWRVVERRGIVSGNMQLLSRQEQKEKLEREGIRIVRSFESEAGEIDDVYDYVVADFDLHHFDLSELEISIAQEKKHK